MEVLNNVEKKSEEIIIVCQKCPQFSQKYGYLAKL
jgi:hypothetical protein